MVEIFINNVIADAPSDIAMSLNFAIADITNPEKRNTNYSKTIKLPGTKTNNLLFSHIFDLSKDVNSSNNTINFTSDFNPNLKADCKIFSENLLQFSGILQLIQINRLGENIEYECSVFGSLRNIMLSMEGRKLEDLDLSEYDHPFTQAVMKNSWDTNIKKNGVDYVNFASGNPTGEGYVYPTIDYGYAQSPLQMLLDRSYPAVYVREYFTKIFDYGGFTWTSAFLDSELFKRLIIPFNKKSATITDDEATHRGFKAILSADDSVLRQVNLSGVGYSKIIIFDNDSTGGAFDNYTAYNPTNGRWVVPKTGYYDLTAEIDIDVTIGAGYYARVDASIFIKGIIPGTDRSGGGFVSTVGSAAGGVMNVNKTALSTNNFMRKGDIVIVKYDLSITNYPLAAAIAGIRTTFLTINTKAGSNFYNKAVTGPILIGDTVQLSSLIPKEIPQKDFFTSIIKMFNLYVQPDPNNDANLIIEPLIDFYEGNTIIDWSDKVDYSREALIRPCSAIEGKNYIFKYKEDTDFYNADYKKTYDINYGERNISVNNDFVKGEKKIELIFSPTPSYGVATNEMVIPRIVQVNEETGAVSPFEGNVRILYYGGVLSAGGTWKWKQLLGAVTYNETTYAYAGHLDHPFTPTLDLLFDMPKTIYWGAPSNIGSSYTTNNLYNKYYSQFISEITDINSKIVTYYLRLRPIDVFKLNFANFIHIDGINFRLNKVIDYNPNGEGLCRVELLKIKRGQQFVPGTDDLTDGTSQDPTSFDILEGGKDEVRSLSATSFYQLVDGGKNVVSGFSGSTNIINGGKD